MIEAAGGVLWRRGGAGAVEVLLVHRPRYDDWTLPKGKLEPGEPFVAAARREVEEETGIRGAVGAELPEVRYRDDQGRPKRVRYWLMEPLEGDFVPNDEVDELRWIDIEAAADALTYAHDAAVIDAARAWHDAGGPPGAASPPPDG